MWTGGKPGIPAIHASFEQAMELLAAASDDYKRAGSDFLRGLLQPAPSKRMTAQDALCHPFLSSGFPEVAPDLMPAKLEKEEEALPLEIERELWEYCNKFE